MPGAHSRPSERTDDGSAGAAPRRSRSPATEVDTARPDTGEIDRNYGDLPRSRADIGPAPLSPPVGFPAMSSSSFRGNGPSADARGARTPDAPGRPLEGGASGHSAPRPPIGPAASTVVPPPPPPRTAAAPEQPGPRAAGSRPPSAPGRGGPPGRPGTPPAGPAAPGRGPRGATVAPPPGAPQAPGRRPAPVTGTTAAAPPNTQHGPGAPAGAAAPPVPPAPPVAPPRVPAPSPVPPTSGPSPAPPLGAAPARPAAPAAPAPRGPVPPRPAGPARPGDAPADRSTRRDASAGPATKVEKPVTDDRDDAAGPDSSRRIVATRTTSRSTARDTTTRSGTTSTPRTAATRSAATSSTSRSHSASGRAANRASRGTVATAVAGVLTVVAARIATLPGGERVVAAGRWVHARVWRYLDGPRPEKLTATALRWQRGRRSAYAALAAMVGVPVLMLGFGWLFISVPNADEAVESQLNTVSFSDGTVLARISPGEQGNRQKVEIARVPVAVQHAVLSAEDRSYYENSGFDVQGIARAVWKNLTGGTGGGSTITQQYVKNAMVGDEYSLMRKYKELIISSKIAQERSKDQILGDYLNSIYFGRGAYGIQAASQAYFGRPVETLTPAEGALLAGIIQSPSRWDPAIKYDDAVRRWNYVMDGMVTQNWLSPADRAGARFPTTIPPRKAANGVPDDDRGHIYSAVKDELARLGINEDALVTEGLQIQTSIQPEAQREAVEAARKELVGQPGNLRSSIVSVDPRDGSVVAYYGGDNGSGLNYAEVSKQPGSTFKPFVLLAALQKDPPIGLSTEFDGRAVPGKTVRNSEGADCDNCNLKRAMTLSNNVVYTALGNKVGPQAIAAAAHQAGVSQKLENPTSGIALGNSETTPFDMASAYATLANDGLYFKPHLVQKVTTASGDVLYDQNTGKGEQRIDPEVARNVVEAMTDVPKQDDAALSGGRVSAAKSGTVQSHIEEQNNDAWFVGFTPGLSTAIWVGTDDNTPIRTAAGKPVFGHGLPSDMWKRYMDQALSGEPEKSFGEFTPIAGGDPGETADGGTPESAGASSTATTSSSSSPTSTTSAPSRGQQQSPVVPTTTAPPVAPPVPAAEAPPAAARVPVQANGTGAGAVEPDAGTVPEDTGG